jgi:hypothetical protein
MPKIVEPGSVLPAVVNPWTFDLRKDLISNPDPQVLRANFQDPKTIKNLEYIIKDVLSGDPSAAKREEYAYLNFDQLRLAISWLMENNIDDDLKGLLIAQPWYLNFKGKPPSPEEFLTDKYIGSMCDSLWHPVRDLFIEYFDPLQPYRTAALNPSIGAGKSTFTMLALLYIACCFAMMRNPWSYFSMAKTSIFVFVLCAVTLTKANEIYREPIQQLIESTEFWSQCRTHQEMMVEDKHLQETDDISYIPFTFATKSSVMQTGNGLNWKVISNANSLLGMNILMGAMTEITFFLEAGKGWTNERLMNFFSKLRQRITNRFQNNYYARFILDSSPSTLEDPIQNWMIYDAPKNPEILVWRGSRWNLYPEEFPDFCKIDVDPLTKERRITETHDYSVGFQLYKGGNGKPPVVCDSESMAAQFETADLVWCPIRQVTKKGVMNFFNVANENPIEFMKDIAGIPAGNPDRIFYDQEKVETCFKNGLKNIYGCIKAPAMEDPEHLIWNQISHQFFYKVMDKYYYYYAPELVRCISVDQSLSKDMTSISMSHVEIDLNREDPETHQALRVFVTDFTLMINPRGGLINLDAIKFFIYDLRRLGNLRIVHTSFDGYQSASTKQFLLRNEFTIDYVSVDADNAPYQTYVDMVFKNRWFCGKNIFIKNNMKSLQMTKRRSGSLKIDHTSGDLTYEYTGDWNTDQAGINAKDSTDAIAGNIWLMQTYSQDFPPVHPFNPDSPLERTYEVIAKKNESYLAKNNFI